MDSLSISVFDETVAVSSTFVKANNFLILKYADRFLKSPVELKTKLLQELWKTEYKADLVFKDQSPHTISFSYSKDMTMFLLRWA